MADIGDVERALLALIGTSLGSSLPVPLQTPFASNLGNSGTPIAVLLSRGYPPTQVLDSSLQAGTSIVSVKSVANFTRSTTRFTPRRLATSQLPITLQAIAQGQTVTLSGTCTAGQVVGIGIGSIGYAVRTTNTSTPASLAAALAQIVPGATLLPLPGFSAGPDSQALALDALGALTLPPGMPSV